MPGRASAATDSRIPDALHKAMQGVMDTLFAQTDDDGRDISEVFHDLIPKRSLPDYYRVIKSPMAMNPVQTTIKKRNYASFATFVRDCAQIFYNAKYYNTTGSQIYEDAVTMEGVLGSELNKLKDHGIITEADAQLPDFGPIPPPSSAGSQGTPDPDEDSADDEEDDDEDEEDKKRKTRKSRIGKREIPIDEEDEAGKREIDQRRKRGRPPKVDTPMECRIKNIMKGLRKSRDDDGNIRVNAFEKLLDAKQFPEYYKRINYPIALDNIRKRIKRREYKSVEQFEADVRLMCENAKEYYGDDSHISRDAMALLEELGTLAETEKARDDYELQGGGLDARSGSGKDRQVRYPLKSIDHNGETYVIGDWVHILNPNDLSKPTVAQIYRTWEDSEGYRWVNACWYYRPEQTVHPHDRKFYEHEVVKTAQYCDHQIETIVGKCFVMFVTKYARGRPRGIGLRQVYVCESRYNYVEKYFNKIKTWKNCIPDEVRSQDYEMDSFEKVETLRKLPSPIAHLLPPNSTEDDPLPEPKMGSDKAPPIVGAVYRRRKEANESPQPEPSPPPPPPPPNQIPASIVKPTPALVEMPSTDYHENLSMAQMYKQAHSHLAASSPAPQQTPQPQIIATSTPQIHHRPPPQHVIQTPMTPQYSQQGHNTPLMRQSSIHQPYTPGPVAHPSPHMYPQQHHIPQNHQPTPPLYSNHQQYALQAPITPVIHHPVPHHTSVYSSPQMQHPQFQPSTTSQAHQQYAQQFNPHQHQTQYTPQLLHQHRAPTQASISQPPQQSNVYLSPQVSPSTFTLPESTTSGIPESIAEQFLRDDEGRILWFTVPPLETPTTAAISHAPVATTSTAIVGPGHSLEYLTCRQELLARKRRRRQERERERREVKKMRESERKKELISVQAALGTALEVLKNQLSV